MLKHIALISLILISCTQTTNPTVTEGEVSVGTNYGEGIVSEDPPGADDWKTDTDTSVEGHDVMAASYEGCSNSVNEPLTRPCNFQLMDQNGELVELYDYEGDVIMLDFSTMWCYVCKIVAGHVQAMHDQYDPFTIITIHTQNTSGTPPSVEELEEWADYYGITTSPVLGSDDSIKGDETPDQWSVNGLPSFFYIDKDFYVRYLQPGWNEDRATGYIEELLAE